MARSDYPGAKPFLPEQLNQSDLASAVQSCRGCDLYEPATQAVFGSGSPTSTLMLVGEQPGDAEDRAGQPFFGGSFRVGEQRGRRVPLPTRPEVWSVATVHPSAVLRADNRDELFETLVTDLRTASAADT